MTSNLLTHSPLRQTKTFWLYICFVSIFGAAFGAFIIASILLKNSQFSGGLLGVLFGVLGFAAVIIGVYLVLLTAQMRSARREFPGALLIPVVVGIDMAAASSRLAKAVATPRLRLKESSYAIVAVNASGLHLNATKHRGWGHIPASRVSFAGFAGTVIGVRTMEAFVLRVDHAREGFDLPIVAIRMRGNPLKTFRPNELDEIVGAVESALRGYPHDGWGR